MEEYRLPDERGRGTERRTAYIVAFEDSGQREKAWESFRGDPEWQQAIAEADKAGPLVHHLTNQIMPPTKVSPLR